MTAPMPVGVTLRPVATPLPLGFLALAVASTAFSAVQLGWVPEQQDRVAALTALLFAAPLQLLAAVVGFLARDAVAATGMGVLAGTWAVAGAGTLAAPPGAASPGLGIVLLAAATALLVPAITGTAKLIASAVMGLAAIRFAGTGLAEITGASGWESTAGIIGLALAALAVYAATAFELEGARGRSVLPLPRSGTAHAAMHGRPDDQIAGVEHAPGVRRQL